MRLPRAAHARVRSEASVGAIGWQELLIVLLLVMLVFGASRLPQVGEGLGKAIRNLKRGLKTEDEIEVTPKEKRVEESSGAKRVKDEEVSEAEVVER
jgi:sec-independent protein translocase protein TatA